MGLLNVCLLLFPSRFVVYMFVSHMSYDSRGPKTLGKKKNHVYENPKCPRDLLHAIDHVEALQCLLILHLGSDSQILFSTKCNLHK